MSSVIAVIDYGMGNLHSVSKALEHVAPSAKVVVSANANEILAADRVVFPGVGAIRDCMAELKQRGLDKVVHEVAHSKPMLAICVGYQCLMEHSEENGGVDGLAILPGQVRFFGKDLCESDPVGENCAVLKVPHMGWNTVKQIQPHPLWQGIPDEAYFYFVHSYFVHSADQTLLAGQTHYSHTFMAAAARDNIFAVQFHPEKSQRFGLQLLKNFVTWNGQA